PAPRSRAATRSPGPCRRARVCPARSSRWCRATRPGPSRPRRRSWTWEAAHPNGGAGSAPQFHPRRGTVAVLTRVVNVLGGRTERFFTAEADLPLAVDRDDLDQDLVALLEDVGHLVDPLGVELRDVDEAVGARQYLHEGAEVDDATHHAIVELPHLRLGRQALDDVDRLLGRRVIRRSDADGPVVLDVDGHARLLDDGANHLAARSDDV